MTDMRGITPADVQRAHQLARVAESEIARHDAAAERHLGLVTDHRDLAPRNSGRNHPGEARAHTAASRAHLAAADAHFAALDAQTAALACNDGPGVYPDEDTAGLANEASHAADAASAATHRADDAANGPNARLDDIGWVGDEETAEEAALEAAHRALEASAAATTCEQGR